MHNSALLGKSRPLAVKKICVVEIRITKRRGSTAAALYIGTQPTVRGYFPDTRLKKKESFGNERRKKKLSEEIRGRVKKLIQVKSKANSRFLPTVSLAFGANWLGPVDLQWRMFLRSFVLPVGRGRANAPHGRISDASNAVVGSATGLLGQGIRRLGSSDAG